MFGEDDDAFDVFGEQPKSRVAANKKRNVSESAEAAEPTYDKRQKLSAAAASSSSVGESAAALPVPAHSEAQSHHKDDTFGAYVEQKVKINSKATDGCIAEVCYPPNYDFEAAEGQELAPVPSKPAKEYPFTLDPFQQHAVDCLERNESVLVSAHTSAGKTAVAEYAIAMGLRDVQRVIYTSPIKALSNQKYRELYEEFEDVGLMTGDITINPSASCLVMTTEILRNMLYRGSEVMREVKWVVFDEIHYMRDKSRGVVWEETLILLPKKVRYVFLSATIPNAREFASWIAKLKDQPCNVVYTDYRPTPLQHYVFPAGGDGLHLAVDDKSNFRDDNFAKALAVMNQAAEAPEESQGMGSKKGAKKRKSKKGKNSGDIYKIVKMVMERHYEPVIIFSFSKRDCETHALQMSKLDFLDMDEKKLIEQIFNNAIDSLSDDDKHLPQVENVLPLLKRGIGIHHGGLLPILKEVIEILFQEGLLKALFATETFAMGLNMPARTVVFTSVRKFDGQDFRVVTGGEYIQMSGRAGRRGLDDKGIVIMMMDAQLEPTQVKDMLQGQADRLNSSFHLGYNMLLNLLRVEEADPEYMMARSFHQFQQNMRAPELKRKLADAQQRRSLIVVEDAGGTAEYYNLRSKLEDCRGRMRSIVNQPIHVLPWLNPGRLVRVVDGELDWGWGIIVNFHKKQVKSSVSVDGAGSTYVVDVLLTCKATQGKHKQKANSKKEKPVPCAKGEKGELHVVPCLLGLIDTLSSIRVYIPKDLRSREARKSLSKSLREVKRRFPDGVPQLDPAEDMKIKDDTFLGLVRKVESWESRLLKHRLHKDKDLGAKIKAHEAKLALDAEVTAIQTDLKSASQDVIMKATLKNMKRVLRRLGHTTANNVIDLKGRVACEISTCDELLGTELMFSGVFQELSPEQTVALCSCLVTAEKSESSVKLKEELAAPLRKMQECAKRVLTVMTDAKMPVDEEEYLARFQPTMMDVTFAWTKGAKFSEVCKMTDVFEGTIIRIMRRLEELLRQFATAAKSIGNSELEEKFSAGIALLKRDIVFAASLYL